MVNDRPTLTIVWDTASNSKQTLQMFTKVKLKLTKRDGCLKLRAILVQDDNL